MKQNGRWAGGQTFPSPSLGPLYPQVQRDAVERGVDPRKVERSTMTTSDLKQTGQLIEAMRGTRLFALTGLQAAKTPSSGSDAVSKRPLEVLLSH